MAKMYGFVYFIELNKLKGVVKIGRTEDLKKRVAAFNTGSPYGVNLIGYIKTGNHKKIEKILHERFKENRTRGEWFEIGYNDITDCINEFGSGRIIQEKYITTFFMGWDKLFNYVGKEVYNIDFCNDFKAYMQDDTISHRSILSHLKKFCKENNLEIEKKRDHNGRYFFIEETPKRIKFSGNGYRII